MEKIIEYFSYKELKSFIDQENTFHGLNALKKNIHASYIHGTITEDEQINLLKYIDKKIKEV